jgi:four helix bundle protein
MSGGAGIGISNKNSQTNNLMTHSIIKDKSFVFALRIIAVSRWSRDRKEYELGRQLLRAGTGIGSNVEEALAAMSRSEFVAKMSIASKEARECSYWVRLLRDSKIVPATRINHVVLECGELVKMLTSTVKTSQER